MNLRPPPAHSDKKKSPVLKKLRRFAFEGMADELKNPSDDKYTESIGPQAMEEDAAEKKQDGQKDSRNAQSMAQPVHGMLVAGGILGNPLFVRTVA